MAKMVIGEGSTLKAAAARFEVSAKTAAKWVGRYRERPWQAVRSQLKATSIWPAPILRIQIMLSKPQS